MIMRAIFGIGLVAFLMPHEPDLGYGRPGARPSDATGGTHQSTHNACTQHEAACAEGSGWLSGLHAIAIRSIDEVRADIEAHRSHRRI